MVDSRTAGWPRSDKGPEYTHIDTQPSFCKFGPDFNACSSFLRTEDPSGIEIDVGIVAVAIVNLLLLKELPNGTIAARGGDICMATERSRVVDFPFCFIMIGM
ncbi:hypothetical protein G7054_g6424 [Neopestalotiopsis clavispora]|nr:hypothetical protein G7054_g6424 [Neopestalotiopsis clavispora]